MLLKHRFKAISKLSYGCNSIDAIADTHDDDKNPYDFSCATAFWKTDTGDFSVWGAEESICVLITHKEVLKSAQRKLWLGLENKEIELSKEHRPYKVISVIEMLSVRKREPGQSIDS